jgi:hypothetical protein
MGRRDLLANHLPDRLWSAKIQSRTGRRERVFVMQSGKDRFGMDSVRFFTRGPLRTKISLK